MSCKSEYYFYEICAYEYFNEINSKFFNKNKQFILIEKLSPLRVYYVHYDVLLMGRERRERVGWTRNELKRKEPKAK